MTRPSISRGGFITSDADERLPPGKISDVLHGRNQKKTLHQYRVARHS